MSKNTKENLEKQEKEKRLVTITNLLKSTALITIFVIAIMIVLKEIGLNIEPIIAGAGIVGLAIGFGAQNLVKDIISGFFILIENQVRVEDIAIIKGTGGLVEEINQGAVPVNHPI